VEHDDYLIIGGGLAGISAIAGIREIDPTGKIVVLQNEPHFPYDRPPLSKALWSGKKKIDQIFLKSEAYYQRHGVDLRLDCEAACIFPVARQVRDAQGNCFQYRKLLLAVGGEPRRLVIPGGMDPKVFYFRTLDDYLRLREKIVPGCRVVVVGGGFIGAEMAAALNMAGADVTLVFPENVLLERIFPRELAQTIQVEYRRRGVKVIPDDVPLAFVRDHENHMSVRTRNGKELIADQVVVGAGIEPRVKLAQEAGLGVWDGVLVNEYLQTSDADIYAAGDIAFFPYKLLNRGARLEHWDNAIQQGKLAGRNMAGAVERYDDFPYFYSDLFDFGFEAVGEIDPKLEIFEDWTQRHRTGVVYYAQHGVIRGVMLCGIWNRVDWARDLILQGVKVESVMSAVGLRRPA
jgi:NADPH-dependent 2,4-dienoyl-CoA reductase/sulfur reductase-like enzyme